MTGHDGRTSDEEYVAKVGRAIRRERERLGWSQRELARRCPTSRSHISRLETGHPGMQLSTLRKVARALGVPLAYLVEVDHPLRQFLRDPELKALELLVEMAWIGSAAHWVAMGETSYVLDQLGEILGDDLPAEEFAETYPEITAWLREVMCTSP